MEASNRMILSVFLCGWPMTWLAEALVARLFGVSDAKVLFINRVMLALIFNMPLGLCIS